jgi:hypothetical protein
MSSPLLIAGIPRSGINIIAAAIAHCGVFGGVMGKQNRDFDEGEYSNNQIRDKVVKNYFDRNGWDNRGQFPIPPTDKVTVSLNWKERVEDILYFEGWKDQQWMYKDSKSCLIWPVWNSAYPNAKWVIVRRRTGDIVQSCLKTGYMTAYEDAEGWISWVHQYEEKFVEMIKAGLNCKVIWPERMVDGDFQQLKELVEWIGFPWNDSILKHVEPLLWGNKKEKKCQELPPQR